MVVKLNRRKFCECGCGTVVKNRFANGGHSRKGKKQTTEAKNKISKTNKGKLIGVSNPNWCGKLMTVEVKKKMSANRKGVKPTLTNNQRETMSKRFSGKNNPNWRAKCMTKKARGKISDTLKGFKHSEETRRKMSESTKGHIITDAVRKKISVSNKGKKRTVDFKNKISQLAKNRSSETKEKISNALKQLYLDPTKTPNWQGGKSFEPYCCEFTKDLKEFIKQRDNYQCQNPNCSKISSILCIHHIDHVKKNCVPKNLITLCNSCNSKANYNKNYWETLYRKIIYSC